MRRNNGFRYLYVLSTDLNGNSRLTIPKCYGQNIWAPLLGVVVLARAGRTFLLGLPTSRRGFGCGLAFFAVARLTVLHPRVQFGGGGARAHPVRSVDSSCSTTNDPWHVRFHFRPPLFLVLRSNGSEQAVSRQDGQARGGGLGGREH